MNTNINDGINILNNITAGTVLIQTDNTQYIRTG